MKKLVILFIVSCISSVQLFAQTERSTVKSANSEHHNYEVKQAFEVESLVPMFLTGGYHFAVCYRYDKFRFRTSVINGGNYDAEPAGLTNSKADFKRYYQPSPGFFLGYNIWRNLELYTFLELHTFEIEQKSSGLKKDIHSTDFGGGISYQFFIGKRLYLQPGLHLYLRSDKSAQFQQTTYHIPNADFAPVFRVGYRLWSKF